MDKCAIALKELASSFATLVGKDFEFKNNGLSYPTAKFTGVLIAVGDDTLAMDLTITATHETFMYANIEQCGYLGGQLFACLNSGLTSPSYREENHEICVDDITIDTTTFATQKTALVEKLLGQLTKKGVLIVTYAVARNAKRVKAAQAKAQRQIEKDAAFIETLRKRHPYLTAMRARKLAALAKEFTKNEEDATRLVTSILELR